jgi:hypothetical protein
VKTRGSRQAPADPVRYVTHSGSRVVLVVLIILFIISVIVALSRNYSISLVSDLVAITVPFLTLAALLTWHYELLGEQASMRRLQTRPQVLVYFARKSNPETNRESLMLVIEHFGGGPALDVQFSFDPPLVNSEGKTFARELPFSTGIPVMAPKFRREIEFDDYYRFHAEAGATRIATMLGVPIEETRLDFAATVTLRDPIGDDHPYTIRYTLDPRDLMPSTLVFRPSEEGATEAAP